MTATQLPALIQQMLQPGFYPHTIIEPIQLIQTHVSYVLLTGEYVYKLKKPVDFGFLNYSTLEKRQHFCAEEIRLNQRGAASLYLEVLPITQTEDQFALNGTGTVVDYAVKMKQFPQTALLSSQFEQGKLTGSRLRELAQIVAEFHAKSDSNSYINRFGEIAQVRAAIDENYEQTTQYIGGPQTQQQFDQTKQYTDQFLAQRQSLFTQRIQQGNIRECHGDLHLGNICYWQDQILPFDCIEFNEPFRYVDVMYDVAFVVMDLQARQRPDLSNVFLNEYVEQTGDWEGLQVLPLYISRQAYVRAKVTSFLLNDPTVPEAKTLEAAETAALYYRLAWRVTQPNQGKLILMTGLSGSGKTTVARNLASHIAAIHIRSDAVRKHLAGLPLHERGNSDLYTAEMGEKTYNRLLDLGMMLASQGYPVILDAKYDRQVRRQLAIAQAQTAQIPLEIYHCTAPQEVLQSRLQQRQDISDATPEILAQQSWEAFTDLEQPYVKTVDTTQDLAEQLGL
ncbi:MAG: AAA family ATPase [Cyanothece sp. SIO1E1]|nr:AAA family ATPase [Cyanothece sp. SIO1E1]